jgi:hypothetical protein
MVQPLSKFHTSQVLFRKGIGNRRLWLGWDIWRRGFCFKRDKVARLWGDVAAGNKAAAQRGGACYWLILREKKVLSEKT